MGERYSDREYLSLLYYLCRYVSLSLCWLSTHILIEKCTKKRLGCILDFSGCISEKAGCIFRRVGCIPENRGAFWGGRVHYSRIFPSREIVTTCQGMNLPLLRSAVSASRCSPPQQGTSIRTMVTLLMSLSRMIAVNFSE